MANYTVFRDKNTQEWGIKRDGAKRTSAWADTQKEAEGLAKSFSAGSGGGEVRIKGLNGKIRDSDTVFPGNDPRSIRDTRY